MNDFSELENDLRKLRPAQPSPVLLQRVEEAMTEECKPFGSDAKRELVRSSTQTPYNWWSLGFGLAAAAGLAVFAVISFQSTRERSEGLAESSAAQPEIRTIPGATKESALPGGFVSIGGAHIVYNARDEGLQYADGSERPVRRIRYRTEQTWRWRNPQTGASLRVSYPSEEIVLLPISGE